LVRSSEVVALNWAPLSRRSLGMPGWFGVPLKFMCSSRWAMPASP